MDVFWELHNNLIYLYATSYEELTVSFNTCISALAASQSRDASVSGWYFHGMRANCCRISTANRKMLFSFGTRTLTRRLHID
jgi:hypothetical protein